jgi:hypothetical protein
MYARISEEQIELNRRFGDEEFFKKVLSPTRKTGIPAEQASAASTTSTSETEKLQKTIASVLTIALVGFGCVFLYKLGSKLISKKKPKSTSRVQLIGKE